VVIGLAMEDVVEAATGCMASCGFLHHDPCSIKRCEAQSVLDKANTALQVDFVAAMGALILVVGIKIALIGLDLVRPEDYDEEDTCTDGSETDEECHQIHDLDREDASPTSTPSGEQSPEIGPVDSVKQEDFNSPLLA